MYYNIYITIFIVQIKTKNNLKITVMEKEIQELVKKMQNMLKNKFDITFFTNQQVEKCIRLAIEEFIANGQMRASETAILKKASLFIVYEYLKKH